jgi:hypothetical protein
MKQQKFLLCRISVLFCLFASIAYSQDNAWMGYSETENLRAMNPEYRQPGEFTGLDATECFDDHPDLSKSGNGREKEAKDANHVENISNINNAVLHRDSIDTDHESLTGAWLQCVIDGGTVRLIPGNLKVFRADSTFSIYLSSNGMEWTHGTMSNVTPDSYIENIAGQTNSIFAGEGVQIKYTFEKINPTFVLRSQYYNRQANRWISEYYIKIPDTVAEKIINQNKN